jgi:hypothetical protein
MAYARLQPLDDTNEYPFENGRNPAPSADTYRTFAQVLANVNALGYNACIIAPDYGNNRTCYYIVSAFNIPSGITDLYIANEEFIQTTGNNTGLYLQIFSGFVGTPVYNYYYGNDHNLTLTGTSNLQSLFTYITNKDSIDYRYKKYDLYDYGAVFLTSAELNLYINGSLPVTYQWSSVPAISGKNGILSLSTLADINDGEAVDTTDATKVVLQLESNVRNLVDTVPLGSYAASGGGAAGSNPQYGGQTITGKSGTQSTGYAFGQGAAPGGGGGLYGGYGAEEGVSPAGAGSGYIGNTLLTNKKMYGYGVAKVTTEDAYTIPKSNHSVAAIEKKPKAGNGYARITYLRPLDAPPVWDGNFFNADFSIDGRDSVRYDSSRTCSFTIDSSAMEPRTALQGQMFDCMYDEPTWTLSNGVLDTGENDNAYLGWLYDYANINNRIIPTTCTFYIDMEVNFYTLDNIELGFFTPFTYEDRYGSLHTVDRQVFMFGFYPAGSYPPYIEIEEASEALERHTYSIGNTALSMSYNEWHTVRFKVELTNGLISKITIYIDGSEATHQEFNTSTEPIPFVCLNSNTYAEWFCRLYINRCKMRKLYIGQDIL